MNRDPRWCFMRNPWSIWHLAWSDATRYPARSCSIRVSISRCGRRCARNFKSCTKTQHVLYLQFYCIRAEQLQFDISGNSSSSQSLPSYRPFSLIRAVILCRILLKVWLKMTDGWYEIFNANQRCLCIVYHDTFICISFSFQDFLWRIHKV